ncbi:transient receptor potential cation channel trpm-like [Parasteatoda tepidariorum]
MTKIKTMSKLWVEQHFQKRECIRYVATKETGRCGCGGMLANHPVSASQSLYRAHSVHSHTSSQTSADEHWSPSRHTAASPTDAFGTIEFQGSAHPLKAQYVRLSFDTKPELLLQLLTREWQLELPKLLITVHGGKANFELQPKLKAVLRQGLVKAAKTTGAWIFTAGTNTGVMRHVGEALVNERTPRQRGRVLAIGIAPWGIIDNRSDLIGKNVTVPYHSISSPKSRFAVLNNHHSYFVLVDNGTVGKYGAEIALRKKLEKYISQQKIYTRAEMEACGVPVVCVVVEGGLNTIRTVLEYVTDTPPVPVVICDGSGRAADLLAFAHRYMHDYDSLLEDVKEQLLTTIERTFHLSRENSERLHAELMLCVRRKDLITVFRMGEGPCQELDQAVLIALLKGHHMPAPDQLRLALTWNRVDIARNEIFVYGQEWPTPTLSQTINPNAINSPCETSCLKDLRFNYPFNELLLWAVLTNRQKMALFMWQNGEEAIVKALVACKLYKAMAQEAAQDDMEADVCEEMRNNAREFENLALDLLDYCYRSDVHITLQLLTYELQNWSKHTCLGIAVAAKHSAFLAHTASQMLVADLWMGGLRTRKHTNLKVILGLLFPITIIYLEFRSREELQLMPQTEEEHNMGMAELDDEVEGTGEKEKMVRQTPRPIREQYDSYVNIRSGSICQSNARINKIENGKVFPFELSLDSDKDRKKNQQKPLKLGKKIYEFYGAPITKFWGHTMAYAIFLVLFTFVVLVKMQHHMSWQEAYVTSYICTLGLEKIREVVASEPVNFTQKMSVWVEKKWNPCDLAVIIFFFVGMSLRLNPATKDYGRVIYCLDIMYWYIRSLDFLSVNKYLGPYVTMIGKMVIDMIYFVVLLLVVLMSYGVARQGILNPEEEPSWLLVRHIFYMPYFMLYGEVFADRIEAQCGDGKGQVPCRPGMWINPAIMAIYLLIANILLVNLLIAVIDMIYFVVLLLVVLMSYGVARQGILNPEEEPSWLLVRHIFYMPYFMLYGEVFADRIEAQCGDGKGQVPCRPGMWINPAIMAIYLLIANILLVNLLIAVFNNIFFEVNNMSQEVWKSQRFKVVMEYEQKPLLPPPLIVFSHIHLLIKYFLTRCQGKEDSFDHGLKLFLSESDVQNIYDFEEECVEGYFREKETELHMSTEEQVRFTTERVEMMSQRVEDINHREKESSACIKTLEFRLTKLEDLAEQTAASLAVIHRYIVTSMAEPNFSKTPSYSQRTMSSICDESEPSDDEKDEHAQSFTRLRSTEAPKIVEPTNEALVLEDPSLPQPVKSPSSSRVQFNDTREPVTSQNSLTPQYSVESQSVFIGGRHQRRLSRTAIDRLGLFRQSTVPTHDTFNVLSVESDVAASEPALARGNSVSQMEDTVGGLIPTKQLVERSASVAVGGGMTRKPTLNNSECSLYPGGLRPHLGMTRGEYTSITDDIESFSMTRYSRPRATSPLTHTFAPSFSRQSSAEYQTLLSVESEILHGAEEADYHMMEGLIKRRLHRDSENLTVSLEELCSNKGESDSELEDSERRGFCCMGGISPSPSAPNVTVDPATDSSPDEPMPKSQSAHSIQTLKSLIKGTETMC